MKRSDETLDYLGLLADPSSRRGVEFGTALAREAIQIWDASGNLILANPASRQLFDHAQATTARHDQIYGDCLREDGSPMQASELPVARIIDSGQIIDNLILMLRQSDDCTLWFRLSGRPLLDGHGDTAGAIVTVNDITDFIEHEQHLERLASYDPLTQLPNRLLLAERMRISLARARRIGKMIAVCMLDLDGFKPVNDNLGHKAGDQLLREVAVRLQESIRGDDTVARVGGDEFALLLCSIAKVSECEQTLSRILAWISKPYQIAGQTVRVGVSAGVALFPDDGGDADLLLRHADAALYQAKEAGKNRFQFFDRKLDMRLQANRGLLKKIEKAFGGAQFVLYYQPIVNCRLGHVEGVEALIRWRHPILGLLPPTEFLPLIEQDDLNITLGEWVIGEALRQLAAWHEVGIDLPVSINISSHHLRQADFTERLAAMLAEHPAEFATRLRIEIQESSVMEDVAAAAEAMRQCQQLGIHITLDNFGMGFASLQHLKRLITNTIKIDQSFVQGILETPEDLAIVGGVVGFAAPFGCKVIAEGAETIEHLLMLLELGCDVIQGFCLARPMPPDKLEAWLRSFQPDPLWRLSSVNRPSRDHFELLLAEANHRAWINDTIKLYRQGMDDSSVGNDQQCPFGAWLRKPGTVRFHRYEEFRQIERLHHAIHLLADKIGANYRDGDNEQARAGEVTLLENHAQLLVLLKSLRNRLALESRTRAFPNRPVLETD